jgi:chaperonin GroES
VLRPLGDRVLIKPEPNPDQTESGLWLSEHRKPEEAGTVVAVGTPVHPRKAEVEELARACELDADCNPDVADVLRSLVVREPVVRVGDYVLFSWAAGQELTIEDERFLLLRESDILCVVDPEGVSA